jgi:hypothetical protein
MVTGAPPLAFSEGHATLWLAFEIFTGTFARLMRVSSWAARAAEERSQQLHYENFR